MSRVAILLALGVLAACSPAPRSASYFKTHPDDASKVIADCAAGTTRGGECAAAQAGEAQAKSDARLSLYKKSF